MARRKRRTHAPVRLAILDVNDDGKFDQADLDTLLTKIVTGHGEEEVRRLMDAYLSLATFPEVPSALHALAKTPLGILSNGSPRAT